MTSKRELKKRLERLEAQRETDRTASESFDGEIDAAVVDAIIEFSHHRNIRYRMELPISEIPISFLDSSLDRRRAIYCSP